MSAVLQNRSSLCNIICNVQYGRKFTGYNSISQPPCRGPVPGPGINYTGPQEVLLEFVILVF